MKTNSLSARAAVLVELLQGPGHGLGLIHRVRSRSFGAVSLNPGNAYPALRRLVEEGMATCAEGPPGAKHGGRASIVYRLTAAGKKEADAVRRGLLALVA